ncbi:MAG: MFS transporter [Actinomycetota bacterium]|nr:MFS transporter [Actinomycetota bacterium]
MKSHAGVTQERPDPDPSYRRAWLAVTLLCVAQFMLVLDVTAANVALPSIGADLSMSSAALTWVVTSYVLVFGGLMLLGGRLADTLGRRRMLIVGLVVFTAASLACGLAENAAILVSSRAVQGLGAALMSPAALATVSTIFDGERRMRALGIWAGIGGAGFVAGLIVSGVLTSGPGWEWVFLVNVPIGLALAVALPLVVPTDPPMTRHVRLDVGGALLVTGSVALLVYGLTESGDSGWDSSQTLLPIALSPVVAFLFVLVERRQSDPLIRPRLLAQRSVVSGLVVMLVASAAMLSLFFVASLYLQHALDFGPLKTGLTFLPSAVAIMFSAHTSSHLIRRFGARSVAGGAFMLSACGAGLLSQLSPESTVWLGVMPGLVLTSLGLGPAFVVATSTALFGVPEVESGRVGGIVNTGHEVGGAIGVGVMSSVAAGSLTTAAASAGDVGGFTDAFLIMTAALALAAAAALWLVAPGRPDPTDLGRLHHHAH